MSTGGQIISVEVVEDLQALNAELALYMEVSKKTAAEVLEKKGRDLGIQLWRGFWELRTKGGKAAFSGPMFKAAEKRGWRTKLRSQVIEDEPYLGIWQARRQVKARRDKAGDLVASGKRRSRRGLLVAQELARRQRGAGLLGASFLAFRKRNDKTAANGWRLVENRSRKLGLLSRVTSGEDADGNAFFRIQNFTPGVDTVGEKNSIFAKAIGAVRADMATYLVRKQMTALRQCLKRSNKK